MFASTKLMLFAVLVIVGVVGTASSVLIQQARSQPPSDPNPVTASDKPNPKSPAVSDAGNARNNGEPITLANVDKLGLLSGEQPVATFIERGPGTDELLICRGEEYVVLDARDFKVLRKVENERANGFSFSGDRKWTSWHRGERVIIREGKTGKTIEIKAGEDPGRAVFSPDNKVVAIGEMIIDENGGEGAGSSLVHVYETESGELIKNLEISTGSYGGLSPVFSPDGSVLAVGNRNSFTKLFDTKTWQLRHVLRKAMTHEIAFSPDGKTLAAGYVDGTLGLWDVGTGAARHMVESGGHRIHSVAWNSTGDLLVTAGPAGRWLSDDKKWLDRPGRVLLWNPKTGEIVKELMDVKWAGSVRFTRDDTQVVSTIRIERTLDDRARLAVWSTAALDKLDSAPVKPKVKVSTNPPSRTLRLPAVGVPTMALSPDGKRMAAPTRLKTLDLVYQMNIWNSTTGRKELDCEGRHGQIVQVAFSPDGSTVAGVCFDRVAKIWDAKTGRTLGVLTGHTAPIEYITYSNTGKYLLTSTERRWPPHPKQDGISVRLWNAENGKLIHEWEAHFDNLAVARFSRDDTLLLTASKDHSVRIWDIASGKEVRKFDLGLRVKTMAYSPDEKTILVSTMKGTSLFSKNRKNPPKPCMKLFDALTGKLLLDVPHEQEVTATFNPTGDQIITETRGVVRYWSTASGEELATFREPLIGTEVIFSPDREQFVVLTPKEPAELWSISKRKQVGEMNIGRSFRSFFSPDGRAFYSVNPGGVVRAWSLDSGD